LTTVSDGFKCCNLNQINTDLTTYQRCAGSGVQDSTPSGVDVFQQEPEQDQEWIFSIETGLGAGAGVIFNHSAFEILMFICTVRDL